MTPRAASQEAPPGVPAVVAVAASAGGLNAVTVMLSGLPEVFPAAVLVVLHLSPEHPSYLADILARHTRLEVKSAEEGELLRTGTVYCARSNLHLLVRAGGTLTLSSGAPVQYVRPSADLLFESVTQVYGPRALAVVLSGTGQDGARGVVAVEAAGGQVIAQDPASAEHAGMPQRAVDTGRVAFVLPLDELAAKVTALVAAVGISL